MKSADELLDDLSSSIDEAENEGVLHPDYIAKLRSTVHELRTKATHLQEIEDSIEAIKKEIVAPIRRVASSGARFSKAGFLVGLSGLLIGLGGVVWGGLFGQGSPLQAASARCESYRFATAQPNGVYYPVGVGLASLVNEEIEGVCLQVVPTDGSKENYEKLQNGTVQFGLMQSDVFHRKTTREESTGAMGRNNVKAVAHLYDEAWHIVVRASSDFDSLASLIDKRVNLGPIGSGSAHSSETALAVCNVTVQAKYHSMPEALAMLASGELDAMMFWRAYPSPRFDQLFEDGLYRLISLRAEELSRFKEDPFLQSLAISKGTYPGIESPIRTLGVGAWLVASSEVRADLVAAFLKLIIKNRDALEEHHPIAGTISKEKMTSGINPDNLHEGAKSVLLE